MAYDGTFDLQEAFAAKQKQLKSVLEAGRNIGPHPVAVGDGSELNWKQLLTDFLPSRYSVSKGFVVDAEGHCSKQIDLIIYDRNFSPLLWELGDHLFIPAESVYAVFEIKQEHDTTNIKAAAEKAKSVRVLSRTRGEFGWIGGKATKEPFTILAGLLTVSTSWKPAFGDRFYAALKELEKNEHLDLGCALVDGSWDLETHGEPKNAIIGAPDKSLVSFCMHLLLRLQKMGTVGGIDYRIYEKSGKVSP